jgi:hypothetical protein
VKLNTGSFLLPIVWLPAYSKNATLSFCIDITIPLSPSFRFSKNSAYKLQEIEERGDFRITTFPVADATRTAHSPVVFPQIANGGGYVSQFIMLDAEGASDTAPILYDENGILFTDAHGIE